MPDASPTSPLDAQAGETSDSRQVRNPSWGYCWGCGYAVPLDENCDYCARADSWFALGLAAFLVAAVLMVVFA